MNPNKASSKPFLSLCMIVKNEQANLPRCLSSAKPHVDEIILVDTGSEDNTLAIAHQYGAIVSHFEWCNDFAAARNVSLARATGDWILVLDADEELLAQPGSIREQLETSDRLAYFLKLIDAIDNEQLTPLYPVRLFRNHPDLKYVSRFHEQLRYQDQVLTEHQLGYLREFEIRHYGYTDEQLQYKNLHRNIPILESIRREEEMSLMLLACLANLYQETGQLDNAHNCFAEAFDRLLPNLMEGTPPEQFRFVPSLLHSLGAQAIEQRDFETAILLCQRGLEWCNNFPPLHHLTGELLRALGFPLGAIAYFETCLQLGRDGTYYRGEPFDLSFTTTFPATMLGCTYMDLKRWQDAKSALELALSFDPNFDLAKTNLELVNQIISR